MALIKGPSGKKSKPRTGKIGKGFRAGIQSSFSGKIMYMPIVGRLLSHMTGAKKKVKKRGSK